VLLSFSLLQVRFNTKIMASIFSRLWAPYERWLQTSPLIAKSVTTAVLGCLGDVGAQAIERRMLDEKDRPFDWHRNLRLTGFGLVLIGPALHGWYVREML
jgi:hypothetical protein